ncbi:MAG TPA: outer membrane beta-barrel domain-containing protein [Polyangia bacterium]
MTHRSFALLAALLASVTSRAAHAAAPEDTAVCLDEDVRADLDAKRRRRSVKERLVQTTNRHELVVRGGHYVSDLFDATWVAGGAYSYHLTEDFAVEASAAWTRLETAAGAQLERRFALLEGRERRSLLFASNLVYAPIHAKLQAGAALVHFDIAFTAGAGVVDSALSSGIAGNAGIGFSFFVGRAMTVRLDIRDYIYRQQLLTEKLLVNDIAATLGVGVLFPFVE